MSQVTYRRGRCPRCKRETVNKVVHPATPRDRCTRRAETGRAETGRAESVECAECGAPIEADRP